MNTRQSIGRYEIIDELGHGAMGSVFRARDPKMNRMVALKTILPVALASEQGDEYRQRFFREAHAAGTLAHPGIVTVFDVGEHKGMPYLVMEFVKGQTLEFALKKGERYTLERVCEIGQQIAEALGYAHRNGVIHRDIKPANILLTSPEVDGEEHPKITDFGVAKLTAGEATTIGQLLGTPAFMPPEQITGAPIDGRADLFSLGVILYWMATGEQPFPGESMTTVTYKIVNTEPVPPASLNQTIPPKLESVILKCLAKNPADRYQTGEELAQDLAQLRASAKATSLQATAPLARGTGKSSENTFNLHPSLPTQKFSKIKVTGNETPAQPAKKKGALLVAAVVLLVAMAAVGGYLLHRNQPATHPPNPEATNFYPPVPAPTAEQGTSSVAANSAAEPASASPAPHSQAPFVAFDPTNLNPKKNTSLRIELDHFPSGLAFTILMDGKIYLEGSTGNKQDKEKLYVKPGEHEFRVMVHDKSGQKRSNTVKDEFLENKHMTLKVELIPPANSSSGSTQAINPAVKIVATLKATRF